MNNLAKHVKTIVSKAFPLCVHFLLSNAFFPPPAECHFKTLWFAPWFAHGTSAALWRSMEKYLKYMKNQSIEYTQDQGSQFVRDNCNLGQKHALLSAISSGSLYLSATYVNNPNRDLLANSTRVFLNQHKQRYCFL